MDLFDVHSPKVPLIVSLLSVVLSIMSLLVTILIAVQFANLEGRLSEQSTNKKTEEMKLETLEAYVNDLRIRMVKAGLDVPSLKREKE